MNIYESLENLNVSEECFDDIMGIVEEILSEGNNLANVVARAQDKQDKVMSGIPVSQKDAKNMLKRHKILKNKDELIKKAKQVPDSKEYKKKISGETQYFPGTNSNRDLGRDDEMALDTETNGTEAQERQARKSFGRYMRKLSKQGLLK